MRQLRRHIDSKVHGASMAPIWGRQDPGGPQFGPMNFAIWGALLVALCKQSQYDRCQLYDVVCVIVVTQRANRYSHEDLH